MTETRRCTKCLLVKPLDDFYKASRGLYGRTAQCKECKAAYHAAKHVPKPREKYREAYTGDELKRCSMCGETKSLREFSLSRKATETQNAVYRSECKPCCSARASKWFRDNHSRAIDSQRRRKIVQAYGITWEQYEALLQSQGGVCAICRNGEPIAHGRTGKQFRLSVDHCHSTGRVRGLLCQKCNRALGLLGDDPVMLQRAIGYLTQSRK